MNKSLDEKLSRMVKGQWGDFILADAKDADMAFGVHGLGSVNGGVQSRSRTVQEYRECIREIVQQQLVDIMLMSVSNSEVLTIRERLFDDSAVTPAIRANDTTDIWLAGSANAYSRFPSIPFRSASIDHAMCGHEGCTSEDRKLGVDLGLYSITLNNDAEADTRTATAYAEFRLEAESKGFRHFLEVFPPNLYPQMTPSALPRFLNDSVVRILAGVATAGRPLFLKMPYLGPAAMEELASYDSSLIVGIMGGPTGTTFDTFNLLWEAKKYGARAALFGRRIISAENQPAFIRQLRAIADDQIEPAEAVRAYHGELQKIDVAPARSLEDDLCRQPSVD